MANNWGQTNSGRQLFKIQKELDEINTYKNIRRSSWTFGARMRIVIWQLKVTHLTLQIHQYLRLTNKDDSIENTLLHCGQCEKRLS